ncbi:putative microcystin synthetase associated thioesterase [Monocercomonoides exilis]|uniref:putative microcystin synthetase associated thioesterase n=1 Tax=Monocercomonoides exilis TaxID=2049356 RepID=UPI003559C72E|nr:putative microcystin synthetase associated thioesterase [Monocercomonoides exilis]|eukprot:MONOS_5686.1-p1 / transcript=MONOS_5686.1 / gene=MONOS_5686 / organism=Monocercomonoides_exilis_PA203 / gene_product=microcystin synthetase associated thioesterase / transcript_product=microcystin synthetase associated thioesterase / location=Mono_scaffold00168:93623-94675(+) / protein_length=254 / sequence_SO=supercontig / SO=protein_coding / is_pseudo=false
MSANYDDWFLKKPAPKARARLFLIPYVGGVASMFASWTSYIPHGMDFATIQLPGRQNRMEEKPLTDPGLIADIISEAIYPYVKDTPYVLFGYSMGGDTAMMVGYRLQEKYHLPPLSMIFAATPGLHRFQCPNPLLTSYSDEEFPQKVSEYFGLDERTSGGLSFSASYVRADIKSMENIGGSFFPSKPPQFHCPFVQFAGSHDKVISEEATRSLKDYTSGSFTYHVLDQGHFFDRDPRFLSIFSEELDDINDYMI